MATWDPATFNPHDFEYLRDPHPTYAKFREHAPVHFVGYYYNAYWVFGYDDVKRVIEDWKVFPKNAPADAPPSPTPPPFGVRDGMPKGIFSADPPGHTQIRKAVEKPFLGSIDDAHTLATAQARRLLREVKTSARFDLYSNYALKLPPHVLFESLGIPTLDQTGIEGWVAAVVAGNDPTQAISVRAAAGTCAFALLSYYQALLAQCPHISSTIRLSAQVAEAVNDGSNALSLDQALATLQNITIAGYLSTTFLIATGTYDLLQNPEQLQMLRDDPSLIPQAVRELLRYNAPAQIVERVAAETVELSGVTIPKDAKIMAVIGSANRDESVFPNADQLDITRDTSQQIAFGTADHECLGKPLVAQVAPVAFRTLLEELDYFAIDGIVQWQTDPFLRSVSNLPLTTER